MNQLKIKKSLYFHEDKECFESRAHKQISLFGKQTKILNINVNNVLQAGSTNNGDTSRKS